MERVRNVSDPDAPLECAEGVQGWTVSVVDSGCGSRAQWTNRLTVNAVLKAAAWCLGGSAARTALQHNLCLALSMAAVSSFRDPVGAV